MEEANRLDCYNRYVRIGHGSLYPKQGNNQWAISVNGVTVKKKYWLADIMEPCILALDTLEQLGATVDTVGKQLH